MYLTGHIGNFKNRLHSLPTSTGDVTNFAKEAYLRLREDNIGNRYPSGAWEKECRKQNYLLTDDPSYLTTPQIKDYYNGYLAYIQTNDNLTLEFNPTGVKNLTALSPRAKEIYCHNCTGITSIVDNSNSSLTLVDLDNLSNINSLSFTACSKLDTINLFNINTLLGGINCEDSNKLRKFRAAKLTSAGQLNLRSNSTFIQVDGELSFPLLTIVNGNLFVYGAGFNDNLTSFSAPLLETVNGYVIVATLNNLTNLNLNSLQIVGADLNLRLNASLTNINLPLLSSVGGNFYFDTDLKLTSVNAPLLISTVSIQGNSCPLLTSVSFPSLTTVGAILINSCSLLTSISLSAISEMPESIAISNNPNLTNLSLGGSSLSTAPVWNFSSNALNQASVNNIIQKLYDFGASGGDVNLAGGTNSPPDAARILLIDELINNNGMTISTN